MEVDELLFVIMGTIRIGTALTVMHREMSRKDGSVEK